MRVTAYGTADELNSFVGVARLEAEAEMDSALSRIQASPDGGLWSVRSFNETMHLYFELQQD